MSRATEILKNFDEDLPPVFAPALQVVNQLRDEGIIADYVIGGSIAILFYSENFPTDDLDLFCHLKNQGLLFSLAPIYQRLEELGYSYEGLYATIEGVSIQFLSPANPLEEEAFETATPVDIEGVQARIFQLEYAMAIKVFAGRNKDWRHIDIAMESAEPDMVKLEAILVKFGLWEKWLRKYGDD